MHAQLTYFDGPRTAEQLAAADFGTENRVKPAVARVDGIQRVYVLRAHDGSEVVVVLADSEDALMSAQKAIVATELLPDEDPALLTGPDRVELFPVMEVWEP